MAGRRSTRKRFWSRFKARFWDFLDEMSLLVILSLGLFIGEGVCWLLLRGYERLGGTVSPYLSEILTYFFSASCVALGLYSAFKLIRMLIRDAQDT